VRLHEGGRILSAGQAAPRKVMVGSDAWLVAPHIATAVTREARLIDASTARQT